MKHKLLQDILDFYFFEKELHKKENNKKYQEFINLVKTLEKTYKGVNNG